MVYQPLLDAVENRGSLVEDIRALLEAAPEEETRGRQLLPVVEQAFERNGNADIIKLLIEHDPTVAREEFDEQNHGGYILHVACACCWSLDDDIMQMLVELNPDAVRTVGGGGHLPIHYQLRSIDAKLSTIQLLVAHFPESLRVSTTDRDRELPLHIVCALAYDEEFIRDEIVRFLVQQYPDAAGVVDGKGNLPIHYYAGVGSREGIEPLIDAFPQSLVMHGGGYRETQLGGGGDRNSYPLHRACEEWNWDSAEFILAANPTVVYMQNSTGHLPIHYACEGKVPLRFLRRMIEMYPASPRLQTHDGKLPFYFACDEYSSIEVMQLLLEHHPDAIHTADADEWLPLHRACHSKCSLDRIRLLVNADPFTLLCKTRSNGRTPLQLAFLAESIDEVKTFLLGQQERVVQMYRDAVEFMAGVRLDFADLVVDRIWHFARPDVWHPEDDEDK